MGSDIGSSDDAQARSLVFGRLRQMGSRLEPAQGGAGAAEAGHERPNRDAEGIGRLLVRQPLDSDEMQGGALLVRQPQESGLDLLEPDLAFLWRRSRRLGHSGRLLQAASLRY